MGKIEIDKTSQLYLSVKILDAARSIATRSGISVRRKILERALELGLPLVEKELKDIKK